MQRVQNPFYQTPLGQTLNSTLDSISQVAMSAPNAWERAAAQAGIDRDNANTQKLGVETEGLRLAQAAPGRLGDVLRNLVTQKGNGVQPIDFATAAPDIVSQLVTLDPNGAHIGENLRALAGTLPGLDPNYFAQIQGGAGQDYKTTQPGFTIDQNNTISMNDADNATLRYNNAADNQRAITERLIQEAGLDKRFTVSPNPGQRVYLAPNNPLGRTMVEGAATPTTVQGQVAQTAVAQPGFDPNAPLVPGSANAGALNGQTTMPTLAQQQGAQFETIANAGGYADPQEKFDANSVGGALLGVPGQGSPPRVPLVTNDQGVRVEDAPGVHVGLPGGKANTPKNYRSPDGKVGLTTDGLTDLKTNAPLPNGTVLTGSAPFSLTEAQGKATGLALAIDDSIQALQSLPANFDPTATVINTLGNANIPLTDASVGSMFLDPNQQRYARAARQALAVILRGDSGAAITAQEFALYAPIYLPQIGDDPALLNDKWKALNDRRQSFISQSGIGYQQAKDAIAQNPASPQWGGGGAQDINALAAEAQQAIASGADPAAVSQRFQQMTGQPLPQLAAPGRI